MNEKLEKYVFGTNINGSNQNGIIDTETMSILCICTEEKAKIILNAFNNLRVEKSK